MAAITTWAVFWIGVGSTTESLPGPHNVQTKAAWDYDGPCAPAIVYYPDSEGKFPLLSFAHGLNAGDVTRSYDYTLRAVTSWGYIVVAIEGCPRTAYEWKAQEALMAWALSHWSAIDHSKPGGIFGHSMGGGSTIAVAGDGAACVRYGLQAAFMMHPCGGQQGSGGPSWIPSLYVSGQNDNICSPATVYSEYRSGSARKHPRGYAVYNGYAHGAPCGPKFNLEVMDIVNWFGCYLYGNQQSCSTIYTGWCENKIPTGDSYGCELFMKGSQDKTDHTFESAWEEASKSSDRTRALRVPWGQHNGTWAGMMHEIKTRGEWAVAQRNMYLRSKGPSTGNSSDSTISALV